MCVNDHVTTDLIFFYEPLILSTVNQYGGYGEMVITGVCGTSSTGSIPVSRPTKTPELAIYLCFR